MQLVVGYRVFHISKTHAYNIIIGVDDKDFKKAIRVLYNLSEVEK